MKKLPQDKRASINVRITPQAYKSLDKARLFKRETYSDIITRLVKIHEAKNIRELLEVKI